MSLTRTFCVAYGAQRLRAGFAVAGKGTDYKKLLERIAFEADGRPCKPVGSWTRNKLALIAYYLPAFARLCQDRAGGWYFVDGFAGNGANRTDGFPLAKGSALLGVTTEPSAKLSLLCEISGPDSRILRERCEPYAERVQVIQRDANEVLPIELRRLENRHLPGFCILDPHGLELDWSTVKACAEHRLGRYPYELLIYFSTPGSARSAGVTAEGYADININRLNRTFGNAGWKVTAELQQSGRLPVGEAGKRYLALYEEQLRDLGYTTVLKRPAIRYDGNLVYHLVFASANDAGRNIMTDAVKNAFAVQPPLQI